MTVYVEPAADTPNYNTHDGVKTFHVGESTFVRPVQALGQLHEMIAASSARDAFTLNAHLL